MHQSKRENVEIAFNFLFFLVVINQNEMMMVYFAIIPIDISSNDEKRNSLTLMLTGVAVGLERNNNINN